MPDLVKKDPQIKSEKDPQKGRLPLKSCFKRKGGTFYSSVVDR